MTSKEKLIEFLKSTNINYIEYDGDEEGWSNVEAEAITYVFNPTGTLENYWIY